MGFFSRSNKLNKTKSSAPPASTSAPTPTSTPTSLPSPPRPRPRPQKQPQTSKPSFTAPPNVYYAPPYIHHHQNSHASQSQPQFHSPPPDNHLPPPPLPYQQQPIVVNHQHYYNIGTLPPPLPPPPNNQSLQPVPSQQLLSPSGPSGGLGRWTGSMVNLARDARDWVPVRDFAPANCAPQLYQDICTRFDDVMTLIDNERCAGNERDLFMCRPSPDPTEQRSPTPPPPASADRSLGKWSSGPRKPKQQQQQQQATNFTASVVSGSYFSKVELYANSKLPANLPPLALYIPTWPLICLAAQYSQRVYDAPKGRERDAHVSADWRTGTKAMCIKSVPMDHVNTIVFAIRGTSTFMDWAVNLNTAPTPPTGFLDDDGNYCHAGFLSVARKMVRPVAASLRQMLQEDPGRAGYSLLITGHSAGGAVAALLYSHMLAGSSRAESELNVLTGCFKRIHCVTFGTPPVSLLPLTRPDRPQLRKSLFLSFVNEGDPVVRADKAYVKSLLELLASPPPEMASLPPPRDQSRRGKPRGDGKIPGEKRSRDKTSSSKRSKSSPQSKPPHLPLPSASSSSSPSKPIRPTWKVPPCTLSNAGRIVVLRSGDAAARPKDRKTVQERLEEGVVAATCREDQLRDMIWGDPVCHLMSLYASRVEVLAVGAVTAKRR